MCSSDLDIELIFQEKRVIRRKRHFDENVNHEITQSDEESFRIDYFLFIVDQAISSIEHPPLLLPSPRV